jgi:O-antigen ligase
MNRNESNRTRRLVAEWSLFGMAMLLLWMADCSTCKASFMLGGFLQVASGLLLIGRRPARVHAFNFTLLLVAGAVVLLGGEGGVFTALGRDSTMSGRTDIWTAVIAAAYNPVCGAGFENFWIGPGVRLFQRQLLELGWYPSLVEALNEAHNGYIETYLNLGWIGLILIIAILLAGYRSGMNAFRRDPAAGSFILSCVAVSIIYNVTEAGFRMQAWSWIFLLLAIVSAGAVKTKRSLRSSPLRVRQIGPRRVTSAAEC